MNNFDILNEVAKMLGEIADDLEETIEDEEKTITLLGFSDVCAKAGADFIFDLVKEEKISINDSFALLNLLSDYQAKITDAIFWGQDDE